MTFCYLFKSKTWQIMPMYALYISDKSISNIMNSLSHDFNILSEWFYNNFMVLNPDKCSFMLLGVDTYIHTYTHEYLKERHFYEKSQKSHFRCEKIGKKNLYFPPDRKNMK